MTDSEWIAYLGTLPPQHRELAQHMMIRIQSIINCDRVETLDLIQRLEELLTLVQCEIEALNVRMDEWDGSRSRAVGEGR